MRPLRVLLATLTFGCIVAPVACSTPTLEPQGSCIGAGVLLQNTFFVMRGLASASDAGPVYGVVKRERGCEDVFVTVTDSVAPGPPEEPWIDGDATGLGVGTLLYVKSGEAPGARLVVRTTTGDWIELQAEFTLSSQAP